MNKKVVILLSIASIFIGVLLFANTTLAQGTYDCGWTGTACKETVRRCDTGYGSNCSNFTNAVTCLGATNVSCELILASGTYDCGWTGTTCTETANNCAGGYASNCSSFTTSLACLGATNVSCEPTILPPGLVGGTYNCSSTGGADCVTIANNCNAGFQPNCDQYDGNISACFAAISVKCELQVNRYNCGWIQGPDICFTSIDTCQSGYADNCSSFSYNETGCKASIGELCIPDSSIGTTACEWDPVLDGGTCKLVDNCGSGYRASLSCGDKGETACKSAGPQTCIPVVQESNSAACNWLEVDGGICVPKTNCFSGYWPDPNLDCTSGNSSKSVCDSIEIVQCLKVEDYGSLDCFRVCRAEGNDDPTCNLKCGTKDENYTSCTTDTQCEVEKAVGWKCGNGNVCEFAGPNPDDDIRGGGLVPCGGLGNPCTFCDFFVLTNNVVDFLIFTLAPILVSIMTLVGGFFVLTAKGSAGQLNKGKTYIKYALLGYLIMLLAWIIVNTMLTMLDLAEWVDVGNWWNPTC